MRQGGRHLAHRGEPRDVDELGLQFLQPRLGLLVLGEIAHETGEDALDRPIAFRRPTDSIGNVEPSLRIPVTMRPMPMMRRSPVVR